MGKITKEQILLPGSDLKAVKVDFSSPEVQESIRKTLEAQEEILKRNTIDRNMLENTVFGPLE